MTKTPGEASKWWRILWTIGIVYIAAIGVFAIEELQRREGALALLKARQSELSAELGTLSNATGEKAEARRALIERERRALGELEKQVTTLIVSGAVQPEGQPAATLRLILCKWSTFDDSGAKCAEDWGGSGSTARNVAATVVLKRPAERTASGDLFAVLVIVAAVGGALIRLYLPGGNEHDAFRSIMRAIGGGIVCYLALSGGTLQIGDLSAATIKNPATASLLGLLSGMFSTKVFELLSSLVESWIAKLKPQPQPEPGLNPDPPGP